MQLLKDMSNLHYQASSAYSDNLSDRQTKPFNLHSRQRFEGCYIDIHSKLRNLFNALKESFDMNGSELAPVTTRVISNVGRCDLEDGIDSKTDSDPTFVEGGLWGYAAIAGSWFARE